MLIPLQFGGGASLLAIGFAILFFFIIIISFIRRYKRCPSDRILVVYGKVGSEAQPNVFMVGPPLFGPSFKIMSSWTLHPYPLRWI